MKNRFIKTVFLTLAFIMGFTYSVMAAKKEKVEDTEKKPQKTIYVLFDNGVTDKLEERLVKSQTQLSDWMDDDLVRVFARYAKLGYEAKLIEKRQDFKPASDSYLLKVKIIQYNPGSKAARIIVGYGAGGVSLKINYDLSADGSTSILAKEDSVFSGIEWMRAARKLNENTAKAITSKLGEK